MENSGPHVHVLAVSSPYHVPRPRWCRQCPCNAEVTVVSDMALHWTNKETNSGVGVCRMEGEGVIQITCPIKDCCECWLFVIARRVRRCFGEAEHAVSPPSKVIHRQHNYMPPEPAGPNSRPRNRTRGKHRVGCTHRTCGEERCRVRGRSPP